MENLENLINLKIIRDLLIENPNYNIDSLTNNITTIDLSIENSNDNIENIKSKIKFLLEEKGLINCFHLIDGVETYLISNNEKDLRKYLIERITKGRKLFYSNEVKNITFIEGKSVLELLNFLEEY